MDSGRSWTICVLCQDGSELGFRHYLFAEILEGFKAAVARHGYDILVPSGHVGKARLSYYAHCRLRKADGVFIIHIDHTTQEARELIESDIPRIAFDYSDAFIGSVMTDCDKGMALLYGHLHGLGHRNIAYMHGESRQITGLRIRALKKAMADKGEALKSEYLIESKYYSPPCGYESMQRLLAMSRRPTAVIASDDYSAIGAIRAVRDHGLSVPGDMSIVGFDGLEISQLMSPRLTTIRQDTAGIAAKAAESLIKQILGVDRSIKPETIVLEPKLLIGTSCRRVD